MGAAGSSALVLICLIISGYLFNLIFYPVRYFSSRAEGQRLFFMAAGSGIILGALVFGVTGTIMATTDFLGSPIHKYARAVDAAIPVPFACRILLTVAASALGAVFLNALLWLIYGRKGRPTAKRVYNKLIDQYGNPLAQLLRRAADKQKLVLLTLKSRKVYCGRIQEVPSNIANEDACIELLPSFSGYRHKDTLRMASRKTDYPVIALWEAHQYLYSCKALLKIFNKGVSGYDGAAVENERARLISDIDEAQSVIGQFGDWPDFDVGDWVKVIPIQEIESASFYDPDAYEAWFALRPERLIVSAD